MNLVASITGGCLLLLASNISQPRPVVVAIVFGAVVGLLGLAIATLARSLSRAWAEGDTLRRLMEMEKGVYEKHLDSLWGDERRNTELDLVARYLRATKAGSSLKEVAQGIESLSLELRDKAKDRVESEEMDRLHNEICSAIEQKACDPQLLAAAVRSFADARGLRPLVPDI